MLEEEEEMSSEGPRWGGRSIWRTSVGSRPSLEKGFEQRGFLTRRVLTQPGFSSDSSPRLPLGCAENRR